MTSPLLCIAHRGAMGHAPENTLLAMETALQLGARAIEVDVYAVQGELLVIHDAQLERTTNGFGDIHDHSVVALRALDAGQGQGIPLLGEVLECVAGRACLNIEIKDAQAVEPLVALLQARLADHHSAWQAAQLLLSAFDHALLAQVKALDTRLNVAALVSTLPRQGMDLAVDLGAIALNPALEIVDQRLVDQAHAHGLGVYVYTVNKAEDLARMHHLGVDGVFSNYPERVIQNYFQPDTEVGWPVYPLQ